MRKRCGSALAGTGGKPYMYIENVTEPTITIFTPQGKPLRRRR